MSKSQISLSDSDINKIKPLFISGIKNHIESFNSEIKDLQNHLDYFNVIEDILEFGDNLIYTSNVYHFSELSGLGELIAKLYKPLKLKTIKINSEIIKLTEKIFLKINEWSKNNGSLSSSLKKEIEELNKQCGDALEFAYLSKKKSESGKEEEKIVPITSSDLQNLKESIYDIYTNFSQLSKEINQNIPERYLKKDWFKNVKNIEKAFAANLINLQKEYFTFRKLEIKQMIDDLEFEIRTFAMSQNKTVKIIFSGNSLKMDVFYIETVYNILLELLKNSVEHGFSGDDGVKSEISVKFSENENYTFIEISDNGKGFDYDEIIKISKQKGIIGDSELSNINEFFFNILTALNYSSKDKSKKNRGLKSVKKLLEKINGSIRFKVKNIKGTHIAIDIPLYKKIV
ncbi:MAG TPA: ATP-binding protein [bacterium]|nr:ATP-binding protein [bacterium]HPN31904.1 ATP-binding protein [bacterium]